MTRHFAAAGNGILFDGFWTGVDIPAPPSQVILRGYPDNPSHPIGSAQEHVRASGHPFVDLVMPRHWSNSQGIGRLIRHEDRGTIVILIRIVTKLGSHHRGLPISPTV